MKFGPLPLDEAKGAILAHSLQGATQRIKKGTKLRAAELEELRKAGLSHIIAARFAPDDLDEDSAASAVAEQFLNSGLSASAPFTGRVNLFAEHAGVLEIDAPAIQAVNSVDEAITIATLPNMTRVAKGTMIATVKIIPYGVAGASVAQINPTEALKIHPFALEAASLILTQTPAISDKVLNKGQAVIAKRADDLGLTLVDQAVVPHEIEAIASALKAAKGELVLILGASATSDRADTCPSGLIAAGGTLTRFGMPVDPGNLLFLGELNDRPVVGLPGCARSPVLNGADWVLERLVAGLEVTHQDIASMGVGGLLKENPKRPQPRFAKALPKRANIGVILLAAGASRRMQGADKLLEPVDGTPILRRLSEEMIASQASSVLVVTRPEDDARRACLEGLDVTQVMSKSWEDGMSASLTAGLKALSARCDAAIVALGDMPEITSQHINSLIAGFSPEDNREIVRAKTPDGTPGHPVLFGRRFFESLSTLSGDRGARDLLREVAEFTTYVEIDAQAAVTDLDTPEAWAAWRDARQRP